MKTKLIFSTETDIMECWTNLPFIPRINEYFNVHDILTVGEISEIKASAQGWSGIKGVVQSVEYRHDDNEFYVEAVISCRN